MKSVEPNPTTAPTPSATGDGYASFETIVDDLDGIADILSGLSASIEGGCTVDRHALSFLATSLWRLKRDLSRISGLDDVLADFEARRA